jgi:type II secretory pathway component PulF
MLNVEFKLEDALAVRFEEGRGEGWEECARELAELIGKGYSVNEALGLISKREKSLSVTVGGDRNNC